MDLSQGLSISYKYSAVGLVALAAYKLGTKLLIDRISVFQAVLCASVAINLTNFPWIYAVMMMIGGLTSLIEFWLNNFLNSRKNMDETERILSDDTPTVPLQRIDEDLTRDLVLIYSTKWGYAVFFLWSTLLIAAVISRNFTNVIFWKIFGTFYFIGSIIFGGGPVVVPLIQAYVTSENWMTNQEFLIGLALIGILPGIVNILI